MGKKLIFFKKNGASERYYEIIVQQVRTDLKKISAVQQVKSNISNTTDSFYFEVEMKHLNKLVTISIRTHFVKDKKATYIYLYIINYKDVTSLVKAVQIKLVAYYNVLANENNFKPTCILNSEKLPTKNQKKKEPKRKLRGTKTELLEIQNSSFQSFLNDFNK
ncbi:hypothetical protein [Vagococcus hydrophili]|uniref:Uncharacterized protein n=1 Tax=Vagococcus hydrophili TaxID=2714947 RepID=A0A6G8ARL3_9ENTE|nr:hypothetical protein [Vagococcus hydrophili]QIL47630.1 hypothetical protein G7082_03295 [Vagococcus hydrophili]